LWTATGFLAGGLILLPPAWSPAFMAACVVAQFVVGMLLGEDAVLSLIFSAANLVVGGATAFLALRLCGVRARRLSLARLTRLLVFAIVPSTVGGALIAGAVGAAMYQRDFVTVWRDWMMAGGLGLAIVLPAVLLAARFAQYREFRRSWVETVGLGVSLVAMTFGIFYQTRLPLLFALTPMVTLIAFRLGPPGAAVAAFLIGSIALPLTVMGRGPTVMADGLDIADRVHLAQAFVVVCLFTGVATAGALADQVRLRRLLIWRDRAARSARARAQEAERFADTFRPAPGSRPGGSASNRARATLA